MPNRIWRMFEDEEDVIVEIPQGVLNGKKDLSIFGNVFYRFHRIPYAKPPVGELRFKSPEPADGWLGMRDATMEGTVCPSLDMHRINFLPNSDEGSLFINVYCKLNPNGPFEELYPVLVCIHGGGFEFGSGNSGKCGPDFFMLYDVIFVTFNYRIGALGFLSLQTIECPGNFGLKDQKLALTWIKKNIAYFGGDPENITIFGISAGGASVQYHTLDLTNKGLFKRAIAQSASCLSHWAYSRNPRQNAFLLGKRLGCDTKDDTVLLDFLKNAAAKDIVLKSQRILDETEGIFFGDSFIGFTFVPTKEPEHPAAFITKHPWVLLEQGKFLDLPYITGMTEREMIMCMKSKDDIPKFTRDEQYEDLIPKDMVLEKHSPTSLAFCRRIKEFYFREGINLYNYVDLLSDTFINYGIYKTIKCRSINQNIKSPTYLYHFTYAGEQPFVKHFFGISEINSAAHGDDLYYLFKTDFTNISSMTTDSRDYKVMRNLTKLWVKFATDGVPDINDPPISWSETNHEDLFYLNLDERFEMKRGLKKSRLEFWDELYSSYYAEHI